LTIQKVTCNGRLSFTGGKEKTAGANWRPRNNSRSCDLIAPEHRHARRYSPDGPQRFPLDLKGRLLFVHAEAQPKMNEVPQLATAMLAVAFAAVMLVAGQLYIEKRSARLPAAPAALTARLPKDKPFANLPQ
jgi:hypothetical protein